VLWVELIAEHQPHSLGAIHHGVPQRRRYCPSASYCDNCF
jgi:hypothetical protein